MEKLVSIVVPTYNQAEFLKETIESLLAQSYYNIEIIIINDGSTDNTKNVLSQYEDESNIKIIHQENMGQSKTLNKGWSLAKGEIIGYLSSDDILKKDCVKTAVEVLSNDQLLVATYCDFDLIDQESNFIRSVKTEEYSEEKLKRDLICMPGPGAFFRRELFLELGGWDENISQIPDFEFWVRLSGKGKFKRIPHNLAQFRIHMGSGSVRSVSIRRSNEIVELVKSLNVVWKKKAYSNACVISARLHFQSFRYLYGIKMLILACKANPKLLFKKSFYRAALMSAMRRPALAIKNITYNFLKKVRRV